MIRKTETGHEAKPSDRLDNSSEKAARMQLEGLDPKALVIVYTNWRGETAERTILPLRMWFGSTEWHPDPQWLLTAIDVEKGAERDFLWNGIDFQGDGPALMGVSVDELAQIIRRVDGGHSLGAGALAEAILAALVSHPTPSGDSQASLPVGDEGQEPVLWVSPAQLEDHVDPDPREGSEGGNYLPARKSMAGLFTMPLYALPHQSREEIIEAGLMAARDLAKTMEGMTGGRADDDYVWGAQAKIEAAIRDLKGE